MKKGAALCGCDQVRLQKGLALGQMRQYRPNCLKE